MLLNIVDVFIFIAITIGIYKRRLKMNIEFVENITDKESVKCPRCGFYLFFGHKCPDFVNEEIEE